MKNDPGKIGKEMEGGNYAGRNKKKIKKRVQKTVVRKKKNIDIYCLLLAQWL